MAYNSPWQRPMFGTSPATVARGNANMRAMRSNRSLSNADAAPYQTQPAKKPAATTQPAAQKPWTGPTNPPAQPIQPSVPATNGPLPWQQRMQQQSPANQERRSQVVGGKYSGPPTGYQMPPAGTTLEQMQQPTASQGTNPTEQLRLLQGYESQRNGVFQKPPSSIGELAQQQALSKKPKRPAFNGYNPVADAPIAGATDFGYKPIAAATPGQFNPTDAMAIYNEIFGGTA